MLYKVYTHTIHSFSCEFIHSSSRTMCLNLIYACWAPVSTPSASVLYGSSDASQDANVKVPKIPMQAAAPSARNRLDIDAHTRRHHRNCANLKPGPTLEVFKLTLTVSQTRSLQQRKKTATKPGWPPSTAVQSRTARPLLSLQAPRRPTHPPMCAALDVENKHPACLR